MKLKTMRDPQDFVLAILLADQAQKHLKNKGVQIAGDFITRQALIGWMLDNPWMYAFLMQDEIGRLDTSVAMVVTPAKGEEVSRELAELKQSLADAKSKVGKLEEHANRLEQQLDACLKEKYDDLSQIIGIGKSIHSLLNHHGIFTFAQLAEKSKQELLALCAKTQLRPGITDPSSWIDQARLLAEGKQKAWLEWKRAHRK